MGKCRRRGGLQLHEPIRVLHVVNKMNQGGVQSLIMTFYRNIDRSKIQFDFVVQDNAPHHFDDEIISLGGRIHSVPRMTTSSVKSFSKAFGQILEDNPDYQVIHAHCNWLNIIPLRVAKKYGVPIRISHSHGAYGARSLFRRVQRLLFQKSIGFYATDFLACSNVAGVWLYGKQFMTDGRAMVVHNAIDIDKFRFDENIRHELRKKHQIGSKTHVLISVGRLDSGKNHGLLMDVFKEYQKLNKDSVLILAGDGPLRSVLERQVDEMGLGQKVLFLGMIANVHEYLSAADLFVFPSFSEGLGITLIEAQTNGLPSVVSEGIPKEADVANAAVFCGLDEPPSEWAKCIYELKDVRRTDYLSNVRNAGYDVKLEALRLENYYLARARNIIS